MSRLRRAVKKNSFRKFQEEKKKKMNLNLKIKRMIWRKLRGSKIESTVRKHTGRKLGIPRNRKYLMEGKLGPI